MTSSANYSGDINTFDKTLATQYLVFEFVLPVDVQKSQCKADKLLKREVENKMRRLKFKTYALGKLIGKTARHMLTIKVHLL